MNNTRVAKRYANALFDFSVEIQNEEMVYEDMIIVRDTSKVSEFIKFLYSPVINTKKKISIIKTMFSDKLSETTLKFIILIFKHNRESMLLNIAQQYIEIYKENMDVLDVDLISPISYDQDFKNRLINKIKNETHYTTINLNEIIDKNIIGGFILKYNDKKFDASIRHQINDLKRDIVFN